MTLRTDNQLRARLRGILVLATGVAALLPAAASAQTDYYNTDRGRPLQIEDAYATERYAFELQFAPVRLERARGGIYSWGIEPEIAYGILPRTQLEVGVPLAYVDGRAARGVAGAAGLEISMLHNLNTETETLPALAIVGDLLVPAGGLGPDRTYPSVKGIVTRTYSWLRFHVNGQYTFGDDARESGPVELSRWLTGVAVDKTFPLKSMLVGAEAYALQPIVAGEDVQWNAAAGIRYQLSPSFAIDGGVGGRLTRDDQSWYLTFGAAYAFGVRSLFPAGAGR